MVKVFTTVCGIGGADRCVDGWVLDHIRRIPDLVLVDTPEECDLVFFSWTWRPEYQPDHAMIERLLRVAKPVVVFDYLECGNDTEIILTNPGDGAWTPWISALQKYSPCAALEPLIKLYFKREYAPAKLPKTPFPVVATDFMSDFIKEFDEQQLTSRTEYDSRPIDLFFCYGYSGAERMLLHAELLRRYHDPFRMCFTLDQVANSLRLGYKNIKALLFIPPELRYQFVDVLKYQGMSKISLSLRGASWKCFRHAEACKNSVMALQECRSDFAFPWRDGFNCVTLPNLPRMNPGPHYWLDMAASLTKLSLALDSDLYPVYVEGRMNAVNYITENYIDRHWLPHLRAQNLWP
jgi:hypothetical protein